jgi:hypothetical protein
MKSLIASVLLIAGLAAAGSADARPGSIEQRQLRQDARIAQGGSNGQLTGCESARLDHRGDRIERREHYYRSSHGLQPWERRDLNRRLDGVSRDIREQRRDGNGCY